MTTGVTVNAHAGWPVKVTKQDLKNGEWVDGGEQIVPAQKKEDIAVWDGHRLIIEEMRKDA